MVAIRSAIAAVFTVMFLVAAPAQALGSFGAVATDSTSGVVGVLAPVAGAKIGFLDNDPADGQVGLTEAIVLSMDGSATVKVGDILLDPGTGLTGTPGSVIQTAPGGTLAFGIGATPLVDTLHSMLRFVDTLPTYANGGPDGMFNPGEPLFLDLDQSDSPTTADRLLSPGAGVSGTVGGAVTGTQSETVWDAATECIYHGTPTAVSVGMKRVSACTIGVTTYIAGSNVKAGDADIGTVLASVTGIVKSGPASRTVAGVGTTDTSTTITSTAGFLASDVGAAVTGTGIPTGAWITTFTSTSSVEISVAATATGSITATINPTGTRTVTDGATTDASTVVTAATAAFSEDDVGRTISGAGIPSGATIVEFTSTTSVTISSAATATGAGIALALGSNSAFLLTGFDAWFGSGTVASGHFRISSMPATLVHCGSYGLGADCGTAATTLANTKITRGSQAFPAPAFEYFDANGNGVRDGTDRIVIDVDGNGFVSPTDVRLTTAGGQTFGAHPVIAAAGEVHGYLTALATTPAFVWLDTTTNVGQVDTTEPLAIIVDDTPPLNLDVGDICLSTIGNCNAGSQRTGATVQPTAGGTWKDITGASNAGALGYLDVNNNNKYDLGDSLYLHFGAALPAPVTAGDLLIASDTGGSTTRATTSPGTLKAFVPGAYHYIDMDGSGTFTVGDVLIIKRPGSAALFAEPGDIRVNTATGFTGFGKNIKEGDPEAAGVLMDTGWTAVGPDPLFAFRDFDSSPGAGFGDPIFLTPRTTGCPPVGSDVNLAQGTSSFTPGTFVGAEAAACTDLAAGTPQFGYTPTGAYSTSANWYASLDGGAMVSVGDIRFDGSAAGAAGTKVGGSATSDLNTPLTLHVLANGHIAFADASGDGVQAGGETIVLDVNGDGWFTPGDLVLSGTITSGGSGGGGGGGGGGTTQPPTTQPPTTTSTATSTTTTTQTTTDTGTDSPPDLAALNTALQGSLTVEHRDDGNHLTFTPPDDAGVQIGRARSPYTLIATLDDPSGTYHDPDGQVGDRYIVTAFTGDSAAEGKYASYEGVDIPGLGAEPGGQSAHEVGREPVPGLGLVLVLTVLGGALAVVRRRL